MQESDKRTESTPLAMRRLRYPFLKLHALSASKARGSSNANASEPPIAIAAMKSGGRSMPSRLSVPTVPYEMNKSSASWYATTIAIATVMSANRLPHIRRSMRLMSTNAPTLAMRTPLSIPSLSIPRPPHPANIRNASRHQHGRQSEDRLSYDTGEMLYTQVKSVKPSRRNHMGPVAHARRAHSIPH